MKRSKKSKKSKKGKNQKNQEISEIEIEESWLRSSPTHILINCRVKPNSKDSFITVSHFFPFFFQIFFSNFAKNIFETELNINLSAPPRDGEANEELVSYMKEALGVRSHEICLASGGKNRNKVIGLENGVLTIEQVKAIIQQEYNDWH